MSMSPERIYGDYLRHRTKNPITQAMACERCVYGSGEHRADCPESMMTASTYIDSESGESVCFIDGTRELMEWIESHPAAVLTGTGVVRKYIADKVRGTGPIVFRARSAPPRGYIRQGENSNIGADDAA